MSKDLETQAKKEKDIQIVKKKKKKTVTSHTIRNYKLKSWDITTQIRTKL